MRRWVIIVILALFLLSSLIVAQNESAIAGEAAKTYVEEVQEPGKTVIKGLTFEEIEGGGPPEEKVFLKPKIISTGKGDGQPGTLTAIWYKLLNLGSLSFLLGGSADNQFCGFARLLLAVLIFSILYMGLSLIPNMSRNIAITIGIVLTIISAVFTPCSILLAWGKTYSALFALVLIGAPILGLGWLLFGTQTNSRGVAFIKLIGVCLLMWLLIELNAWAAVLAAATP